MWLLTIFLKTNAESIDMGEITSLRFHHIHSQVLLVCYPSLFLCLMYCICGNLSELGLMSGTQRCFRPWIISGLCFTLCSH